MSPPRLAIVALTALFTSALSLDPRAPTPPRRATTGAAPKVDVPATITPEIRPITPVGPLPRDMTIEVTPEPRSHRVTLRRPGHLVALLHGPARAAGVDRASVSLAFDTNAEGRIVWEATKLGTLVTERGFLSIRLDGAAVRTEGFLAAPPETVAASRSDLHTCSAHRDDSGGFSALCLLSKDASTVTAANVTGQEALQDVWVAQGKLVRIDFPLAPGLAESKVITVLRGLRLSVLRVEAIWPDGEAPMISFHRSDREQPSLSNPR